MRERTKRLAVAVVLTIVDIAAGKYFFGVVWQTFARDPFAKFSLLGLLCLWFASAVVLWLYLAYDLREALRVRDDRRAFDAAMTPAEPESEINV